MIIYDIHFTKYVFLCIPRPMINLRQSFLDQRDEDEWL
jgi:hypothetical protein